MVMLQCHDIPYHGDAAVATKKRKRNCGATAQYSQTHYQMEGIKSLLVLGDFVSRLLNGRKDCQMKMVQNFASHYELLVTAEGNVLVSCKLCCRNVSLSSKHKKPPNWTRHIRASQRTSL